MLSSASLFCSVFEIISAVLLNETQSQMGSVAQNWCLRVWHWPGPCTLVNNTGNSGGLILTQRGLCWVVPAPDFPSVQL